MVSDFLVQHPSCPFFFLNDEEYKEACMKYPTLADEYECEFVERVCENHASESDLPCECQYTCTGGIVPGADGYFDSGTILDQFERLFQMLEFKREYNFPVKHTLEIVVDNATTHNKKIINIYEFRFFELYF